MSAFSVNSYAASVLSSAPLNTPSRLPTPATEGAQVSPLTQTAAVAVVKPPKATEEKAKLDDAVATINQFLKPIASSVQFSVDEDSGRTLVKVIDTDTNSILRQFPSKEALAISTELGKLQGLLLKDKA